jgi:hypothetical protein
MYAIAFRATEYQHDLRDMVLEKAKRLEELGWEEYTELYLKKH